MKCQTFPRKSFNSACLSVDDTQHVRDHGTQLSELPRRVDDLTAGRDDIFDDHDSPAVHVTALGKLTGAVLLRLLADKDRWYARDL